MAQNAPPVSTHCSLHTLFKPSLLAKVPFTGNNAQRAHGEGTKLVPTRAEKSQLEGIGEPTGAKKEPTGAKRNQLDFLIDFG